jgi:hypothetical protein
VLSFYINRAHVDHGFHAKPRAHHRRGDAMLARARLRDEPRLAEKLREQALTDDIVRFMRAAVEKILALEDESAVV